MVSDRVTNGMAWRGFEGVRWAVGSVPYGYIIDPKEHTFVASDGEAVIVE